MSGLGSLKEKGKSSFLEGFFGHDGVSKLGWLCSGCSDGITMELVDSKAGASSATRATCLSPPFSHSSLFCALFRTQRIRGGAGARKRGARLLHGSRLPRSLNRMRTIPSRDVQAVKDAISFLLGGWGGGGMSSSVLELALAKTAPPQIQESPSQATPPACTSACGLGKSD